MTRNIYLQGKLGKLFGEHWKLNASTVQEAMHGIDVQRDGKLRRHLIECTEKGIEFSVKKGKEFLDYDNLQMELGEEDIIITPLPVGAGKTAGRIKAIIGIALIIIGIYALMTGAEGSQLLAAGWYLIAGGGLLTSIGIAEFLTPNTPSNSQEGYLFNGPENTLKQGIPVPLCYGELVIGGAPINFGFVTSKYSSGFKLVGGGETGYASHDTYGRYQFIANSSGSSGSSGNKNDRQGGTEYDFNHSIQ